MEKCPVKVGEKFKKQLSEFLGEKASKKYIQRVYDELSALKDNIKPGEDFQSKLNKYLESEKAYVVARRKQHLQNIKKVKMLEAASVAYGDNPQQFIFDLLNDRSNNLIKNSNLNTGGKSLGLRGELRSMLDAGLDKIPGAVDVVKNGALEKEIMNEVHTPGSSGSDMAKKIGSVVSNVNKRMIDLMRESGSLIGEVDNYVMRQVHDFDKIIALGENGKYEWVKKLVDNDWLDEKTFDNLPDGMSRVEYLLEIHDNIVFGRHDTYGDEQIMKDVASKSVVNIDRSKHRALHFKDGESLYEYNKLFGRQNLFDSIYASIDNTSKKAGILQVLGSDPKKSIDSLIKKIETRLKKEEKFEVVKKLQDGNFVEKVKRDTDQMLGWNNHSSGNLFHQTEAITTTAISFASLGQTFLYLPVEAMNSAMLITSSSGKNYLSVIGELTKNFATMNKTDMQSMYLFLDEVVKAESSDFNPGVLGQLSKARKMYYKLNGEHFKTTRLKYAAAKTVSNIMANRIDMPFDSLQASYKAELGTFGIGDAEWQVLKRAVGEFADGTKGVTPQGVAEIATPLFEKYAQLINKTPEQAKKDLELKLAVYHNNNGMRATTTPGPRTQSAITGGHRPDTFEGAKNRIMRQFRSFALESGNNISKIFLSDPDSTSATFMDAVKNGKGNHRALASYAVNMLGMGYMVISLKALINGKEQPDPHDPQTWLDAAAKGGVAGIYGDFIFGSSRLSREQLAKSLLGPALGKTVDVHGLIRDAATGRKDKDNKRLKKFVTSNIPGNNLPFIKPALDYLILDEVKKAVKNR